MTDRLLDAAAAVGEGADPAAREMAKNCLFDWMACAIAGSREPLVQRLLDDALEYNGAGTFALLGRPEQLKLRDSVLVNGAAAHALDYDDGLAPMMGHPSVAIVPAVLGLAAHLKLTGQRLQTALIVAVDVAARTGLLLSPTHYDRGFHATATMGAVAAAAGCAYLLGLDGEKRAWAIGLAGARAAGLKASFGTEAKPLHPAWASLVGITAAQWAQRGYIGAADIIGHDYGLRTLADSYDPDAALAPSEPYILKVQFKNHAACAGTHATIEAILKVREQHQISADDVENVSIRVNSKLNSICNLQSVQTGLQAKFSLRMVTAMALARIDTAVPANFSDELVTRASLQAVFNRVRVELVDGASRSTSEVAVTTRNGQTFALTLDLAAAALAVRSRRVRAKFAALVQPVLGESQAARLATEIEAVEQCPEVTEFLELARKSSRGA
jgi:2-methylcitrate dehydratase PrpD